MNLKEAFRYQNKLQELTEQATEILEYDCNVTVTENTHLRKKVMPEAENETIVEAPSTEYADRITEIAEFLMFLQDERERLCLAVYKAKMHMELGLDTVAGINASRRNLLRVFKRMAELRSSETVKPNMGYGYRFNAEGNQVTYKCDLRQVTTINFDRNRIRSFASVLAHKADETSTEMDLALVNTAVDYEPKFDVNDSFEEVFSGFCNM